MSLFLFSHPRHLTYYYRGTARKSSTHGQFYLKDLRRNTNGNLKIYGYTTHPIHKALENMDLTGNVMAGHMLEIDDPAGAIWIKLNHDQMSPKKELTYCGNFKEIDVDKIKEFSDQYQHFKSQMSHIRSLSYEMVNGSNYLSRILNSMNHISDYGFDEIVNPNVEENFSKVISIFKEETSRLDHEIRSVTLKANQLRKDCVELIAEAAADSTAEKLAEFWLKSNRF